MDQEVEIISSETRKEKIKNFIINKKKTIIASVIFLVLILFSVIFYNFIVFFKVFIGLKIILYIF